MSNVWHDVIGNNDRGTLVVPDNAVDGLSIYQRNYDAIYRKNANKDYIKDFLEQLKKKMWLEMNKPTFIRPKID
ncbi:MAG: hypothetical protein ACLTZB_08510 [Streptococcus salivarius]